MTVSLIVAVSENNVIGKDRDLIWHLPNDMRFFKKTTLGHYVIMGRKNFESIPHKYRPLSQRTNVIISRNKDYKAPGCIVVNTIEDAIALAKTDGDLEPFIIGGGEIYNLALKNNLINKIYLTRVHKIFEGDTYFPRLSDEWKEIDRVECKSDDKHVCDYTFLVYKNCKFDIK